MIHDDDDAWLEALAGRIEPEQVAAEQQRPLMLEAIALREWIRRQESPALPDVVTIDAKREEDLLGRARLDGLLARTAAGQRARFRLRGLGLAAAAVLFAAVGIELWQSTRLGPQETFRGLDHGTIHLVARDPPALKRQLTEELQAAGATVLSYERLGRVGIDVDLPQPLPAQIARILERHHIPLPSDGVLVVEIEAPDSR
jgi:hypothetical protein